jgi:hypothetical protein
LRTLLLALLLSACGRPQSGTNAGAPPVASSPTTDASASCEALEAFKHGKVTFTDPGDFQDALERCYAPTGSLCERAWIISQAMPAMADPPDARELALERAAHFRACESLRPEVQRCLTAYRVRHSDECDRLAAWQTFSERYDAARRALQP